MRTHTICPSGEAAYCCLRLKTGPLDVPVSPEKMLLCIPDLRFHCPPVHQLFKSSISSSLSPCLQGAHLTLSLLSDACVSCSVAYIEKSILCASSSHLMALSSPWSSELRKRTKLEKAYFLPLLAVRFFIKSCSSDCMHTLWSAVEWSGSAGLIWAPWVSRNFFHMVFIPSTLPGPLFGIQPFSSSFQDICFVQYVCISALNYGISSNQPISTQTKGILCFSYVICLTTSMF